MSDSSLSLAYQVAAEVAALLRLSDFFLLLQNLNSPSEAATASEAHNNMYVHMDEHEDAAALKSGNNICMALLKFSLLGSSFTSDVLLTSDAFGAYRKFVNHRDT